MKEATKKNSFMPREAMAHSNKFILAGLRAFCDSFIHSCCTLCESLAPSHL